METVTRRAVTARATMAGLAYLLKSASAQQAFPAGMTIKFVVPFAAGGVKAPDGRRNRCTAKVGRSGPSTVSCTAANAYDVGG
jgi:hypothetical protein